MPLQYAKNIVFEVSPLNHSLGGFGLESADTVVRANIGNGVVATTLQGFTTFPYPYGWLYDIVVVCTAATATAQVDVQDAHVSGAQGNSYLTGGPVAGPITVPASAAVQTISARASGQYNAARDPHVAGGYTVGWGQGSYNNIPFIFKTGQIFSVRCITNGSGSLTNLMVQVIWMSSDQPFIATS